MFPLFNSDESILNIFKFEKKSCGHEFQGLSILLVRKVPLKVILLKKLLFAIITDVNVELQFLERSMEYFILRPFGKFWICCAVVFTVFLILCSSYFR